MATAALSIAEKDAFSASYEVNGFPVTLDLGFVKRQLVRGRAEFVTDQEVLFFINTCRSQRLDPRAYGTVYLIKYSKDDPAQMVVGKDSYIRRMFEHPEYLCKKDGITVKRGDTIVQKEGSCLYPGEELVGGWARIYFVRDGKEREAFKEVALTEYNRGLANWKTKPATMINKVAISQCAREAFPKDFTGMYSEDELVASGAISAEYTTQEAVPPNMAKDERATQEQRRQLFAKAKAAYGDNAQGMVAQILGDFGLVSTADMLVSTYEQIMKRVEEDTIVEQAEPAPDENVAQQSDIDSLGDEDVPAES